MKNLAVRQIALILLILIAALSLWLGISLPIIKLSKYYFDEDNHSILTAVEALLHHQEYLLGGVIFVFAILMPALKLLYLLILSALSRQQIEKYQRVLMAVEWFGKWSMQDVLILAFTILYLKSSRFSEAVNLYGVYFFALSVFLIMIAHRYVRKLHRGTFNQMDRNKRKREALYRPETLSETRRYVMTILTLGAVVFLVLGVTWPSLQITHLYFLSQEHSILSAVIVLYEADQVVLAAIIFSFSIIFPGIKLIYLITILLLHSTAPQNRVRFFKVMDWLGRWSMMDVMILALMVFYMNGSAISTAATLPGIYFFAMSVCLTMIAYGSVKASRTPDTLAP